MVYRPKLPDKEKLDTSLDAAIASTIRMLDGAWIRFNSSEQEMVEESIYEIKMLQTKLDRLIRERKGQ